MEKKYLIVEVDVDEWDDYCTVQRNVLFITDADGMKEFQGGAYDIYEILEDGKLNLIQDGERPI